MAPPRWLGTLAVAYAYLALALFFGTAGYSALFLTGLAPRGVDGPPRSDATTALAMNLALLLAFGLQHSVMAREGFKRLWNRVVPAPLERATYLVVASVVLTGLMVHWQPMPAVLWSVSGPATWLLWGLFLLAGLGELYSSLVVDALELVGVRQARCFAAGRAFEAAPFREESLYAHVRHPMMAFLFPLLWVTPHMTAGRFVLAAGMSAYIIVGTALEERGLRRTFGAQYLDYQRRVPMFFPKLFGRRRAGPQDGPSV